MWAKADNGDRPGADQLGLQQMTNVDRKIAYLSAARKELNPKICLANCIGDCRIVESLSASRTRK